MSGDLLEDKQDGNSFSTGRMASSFLFIVQEPQDLLGDSAQLPKRTLVALSIVHPIPTLCFRNYTDLSVTKSCSIPNIPQLNSADSWCITKLPIWNSLWERQDRLIGIEQEILEINASFYDCCQGRSSNDLQ